MAKECGSNQEHLAQGFKLNAETGYFQNGGVDVMAFDDFYPEGHQGGVSIIMHGNRVATNGDLRFERMPALRSPIPKQNGRVADAESNTITASLSYPDPARNRIGFSPMEYPDVRFDYKVTVKGEGASVSVTVDLGSPIPAEYAGKICFILELFPGALFGKPWMMDDGCGIFPDQPVGPVLSEAGGGGRAVLFPEPYATGKRLIVRPDDPYNRLTVESQGAELKLYDGRMLHNNGWFIVSSAAQTGVTEGAVRWVITPNAVEGWLYKPVVQASQVGYHPDRPKVAIIELDSRERGREKPALYKLTKDGTEKAYEADCPEWGRFLRYNYVKFDFSPVKEEGIYKIAYGGSESSIFRIARGVYDRGVWQPVLEYFLPVQMCHMRVNERSRVWHGFCHDDDAKMAPVSHNHFDGYLQGPSTLTKYKPGEVVPGLNAGGWHDAGDDDLRTESQAGECYILAMAYEAFNVDYDTTTIDQAKRIVEIHKPDGKNDILQQIEHGALSVVGAYRALGRLYRGIISSDIKQYVILGDTVNMTDNIKGNDDDRWVFTEENPPRELTAAAHLAAVARVLKGFNGELSAQSLQAARELFEVTDIDKDTDLYKVDKDYKRGKSAKLHAAAELFLTTGEAAYKDYLLSEAAFIAEAIDRTGWFIGRAEKAINDAAFTKTIRDALPALKAQLAEQSAETPYGIPYRPHIWGAGWMIQRLGFEYYFLHDAYPEVFGPELLFDALDFILGRHPGSNNMSFASGIGTKSALVAYGLNRADWSYIPGGVISGTALIRPDFPELLVFPYLWQQVEYVLGGGSSHYMFLVLAAQKLTCLS